MWNTGITLGITQVFHVEHFFFHRALFWVDENSSSRRLSICFFLCVIRLL